MIRTLLVAVPVVAAGCVEPSSAPCDDFTAWRGTVSAQADEADALDQRRLESETCATERIAPARPRADVAGAWHALETLAGGEALLERGERGTPTRIELAIPLAAHDADAARLQLDVFAGHSLATLFERSPADELVADGEGYRRWHLGLPVFDDRYRVSLQTENDGRWHVSVHARWTGGVSDVALVPKLGAAQAVSRAIESGEVLQPAMSGLPTLGICTIGTSAALCWDVRLNNELGNAWGYRIDAVTGDILHRADRVRHVSGTVSIPVPMPGSGASYETRPLPNGYVYEDTTSYTLSPACGGASQSRLQGDDQKLFGSTGTDGSYNFTPTDPNDTSWVVDFRGPYVEDESRFASLAMPSFAAGGSSTYSVSTTYARARRGETFYMLNYGRSLYASVGITQHPTVRFNYYALAACGDYSPDECVGGSSVGECATYDVHEATNTVAMNRRLRNTLFHEHNHLLYTRVHDGYHCGENECWPAEEGRADFGAIVATRFELAQPPYFPDLTYPEDYSGGVYGKGAIWTAMYAHYLLRVGVPAALAGIHRNLSFIGDATIMVGTCQDTNANGQVEVFECPADSFYRWLLDADAVYFTGPNEHAYELSEVFHAHVTDADRVAAGVQSFPWADELPNTFSTPPFVAVERGNAVTVSSGGPTGSGNLRFYSSLDHDNVMFQGRANETYLIETLSLSSGMDTIIEVYNRTGTSLLASNDDCAGSVRSCLSFTPTSTAYYVVRARPKSGSSVGATKTYQMKLTMTSDDYGDTMAAAASIVPNGSVVSGAFSPTGDVDVFRIVSGSLQTLTYSICATGTGATAKAEILDKTGFVHGSSNQGACPGTPVTVTMGSGPYAIRVSATSPYATGYQLTASLPNDLDVDDTPANAWPLTTSSGTPRIVGGSVSSSSDVDWYRIQNAVQGKFYTIETHGASFTSKLEVYAPSTTLYGRQNDYETLPDLSGHGLGYPMLVDSSGAIESSESRIAFMAPASGDYYVKLSSATGSTGAYHIIFEDGATSSGWSAVPFF